MDDEEPREYKPEKTPFSQRHPIISILISLLVTGAIFVIQCWLWSFLIQPSSFWIPALALIGTVLIVYWIIKKAKNGIMRSLFVFEMNPADSSDAEYSTAYQKKSVRKKVSTPAPDTMTENQIKDRINKSKRIQDFLKRWGGGPK